MNHLELIVGATVSVAILAMLTPVATTAAESYFYEGITGRGATFYLIGGDYSLYVYARRPLAGPNRPEAKVCIFGGNLQRTWPTHDTLSLGSGVTISTIVPHKIGPKRITLDAGLYHLFIPPATDCAWKFVLNSTDQNPAGISPVTIFRQVPGGWEPSATAALGDTVEFYAQYRTEHDDKMPVSATFQVIHDGRVVRTSDLAVGVDHVALATTLTAAGKLGRDDAKYLGSNTVRFIVKIGSAEFTSSGEFTITK